MKIVFAMILSIAIKAVSALIEIVIQLLITNKVGVSEYGKYIFFVSLIEGAYFILFSGSVKLNTYYLSSPSCSLNNFKKKYILQYVTPIIMLVVMYFAFTRNYYGVLAGIILYVYYFSFDISSVFFSKGLLLSALLGEYLFGRIVLLIGLLIAIKYNATVGIVLLGLYGLQFITMLIWFIPQRQKLNTGTKEVRVPKRKLIDYQVSDIANSLINYSPTVLQYFIVGPSTAGFTGIISIVKRCINFISGPTAKVFLPEFSRLYKNDEKEKLEKTYLMIVHIQMVFISTIGAILIGFPNLILRIFSPELEQYSEIFLGSAIVFLIITSLGPVTGMLQMTEKEHICNRNQWISIGTMCLVWVVMRNHKLFAIYGLCVQAVVEGIMKYLSLCNWFGKNILPIKDIILSWFPIMVIKMVVDNQSLQHSFWALIISALCSFIWNMLLSLRDPLIKTTITSKLEKLKSSDEK